MIFHGLAVSMVLVSVTVSSFTWVRPINLTSRSAQSLEKNKETVLVGAGKAISRSKYLPTMSEFAGISYEISHRTGGNLISNGANYTDREDGDAGADSPLGNRETESPTVLRAIKPPRVEDPSKMSKRDVETTDVPRSDNDSDWKNRTLTDEEYLNEIVNFIFPKMWTWVLIVFHSLVFVVGLVGNTLVCAAVYRNHTMRTVTNYFITNLALADFLVIFICLPPTVIWDVTMTWFFGVAMCKVVLYLQVSTISRFVSRSFNDCRHSSLAVLLPLRFSCKDCGCDARWREVQLGRRHGSA